MKSLKVKGFEKLSLVDWDGVPCSVIFLGGCNFRCPFCYNSELVLHPERIWAIPFDEAITGSNIMEILEFGVPMPYVYDGSLRKFDGVCITGGEPTIHKELPEMCKKIKSVGLKVKLDTNGTNPAMLQELIKNNLVDYIAMDIKDYPNKHLYSDASGITITRREINAITNSTIVIMTSGIDYEFRTTVVPPLHNPITFGGIGKWLEGAKKYVIQNFIPSEKVLNPEFQFVKPFKVKYLKRFAEAIEPFVESVKIRSIQKI